MKMGGIHMTIGKRILNERLKLNLSQKDLGRLLNVSDKIISRWENDISFPSIDMLNSISNVFNVTIEDLLESHGNKKSTTNLSKDKTIITGRDFIDIVLIIISWIFLAILLWCEIVYDDELVPGIVSIFSLITSLILSLVSIARHIFNLIRNHSNNKINKRINLIKYVFYSISLCGYIFFIITCFS